MRHPVPNTTVELDSLEDWLGEMHAAVTMAKEALHKSGNAREARSHLALVVRDARYLEGLASRAFASIKPGLFDEPTQETPA